MFLNEYRELKKQEIKKFLDELMFQNIGNREKPIIPGLTPECSAFFNKDILTRKETEKFLRKIQSYYMELVDTYIEFLPSKEQIDQKIREFLDKVRKEIDIYKHNVIKLTFQPNREEIPGNIAIETLPEVPEKNIINTGLESIKIQIGDIVNQVAKTGREAEKEDEITQSLKEIMIYVYYLICMIEDKKQKKEEFIDIVASNFDVKDPSYQIAIRKFMTVFLNEKDYKSFIEKYTALAVEYGIDPNKPRGRK